MGYQYFYHGSSKHIDFIKTHISTHGISAIYATPYYDFALCYAGGR